MPYIVGRPFKSHMGTHMTGDELKDSEVDSWPNVHALLSAHFLYRITGEASYSHLPAHLYTMAMTRKEAKALNERTSPETDWEKPSLVAEEEKLHDAESESLEKLHIRAEKLQQKRAEKDAERAAVSSPVKVPTKTPRVDTAKKEADARGTDFDPDEVRQRKLEDLKDEAKSRGLSTSGNKPEIAQRIIDDEIEKNR